MNRDMFIPELVVVAVVVAVAYRDQILRLLPHL